MLLLIKKHTDALIEKTKTKPQETLKFKVNKQMETFSFNPTIYLFGEGKWSLVETSFAATNSFFNITDENINFSISTPSCWIPKGLINKPNEILELRSQNDIELHLEEVEENRHSNRN